MILRSITLNFGRLYAGALVREGSLDSSEMHDLSPVQWRENPTASSNAGSTTRFSQP